ncbi:MAG: hypothetical protein ACR2NU_12645 [Aeoliella sp.]
MLVSLLLRASASGQGTRWLPSITLLVGVVCSSHSALGAEQKGWGNFLPFGQQSEKSPSQDEAAPYPTTDTGPTTTDTRRNDQQTRNPTPGNVSSADSSSNWLLTSPFANVTWPEIKMPKMVFRSPWGNGNGEGEGWFTAPIAKVRTATQNAFGRTRTAWNDTVERMKFALPGGDRSANSAPQVASKPNRGVGFWDRLMGKPDTSDEPDGVVEMMAREPTGPQR